MFFFFFFLNKKLKMFAQKQSRPHGFKSRVKKNEQTNKQKNPKTTIKRKRVSML